MAQISATAKIRARRLEELADSLDSHDMDIGYIHEHGDGHVLDTEDIDAGDVELIIDGLRIAARALQEGKAT